MRMSICSADVRWVDRRGMNVFSKKVFTFGCERSAGPSVVMLPAVLAVNGRSSRWQVGVVAVRGSAGYLCCCCCVMLLLLLLLLPLTLPCHGLHSHSRTKALHGMWRVRRLARLKPCLPLVSSLLRGEEWCCWCCWCRYEQREGVKVEV